MPLYSTRTFGFSFSTLLLINLFVFHVANGFSFCVGIYSQSKNTWRGPIQCFNQQCEAHFEAMSHWTNCFYSGQFSNVSSRTNCSLRSLWFKLDLLEDLQKIAIFRTAIKITSNRTDELFHNAQFGNVYSPFGIKKVWCSKFQYIGYLYYNKAEAD